MSEIKINYKPIIGITCHADTGGMDDIFPGRALNYIDRNYADILIANDMIPFLIPVNSHSEYWENTLLLVDGLVCSGGGKIPEHILSGKEIPKLSETAPLRYSFENMVFKKAIELDLPILGMCRGMQMLNEIFEGEMYLKISDNIPSALEHNQIKLAVPLEKPYHTINIEGDSHLARILGKREIKVNSWHSQAISRPGRIFRVVARSEDGVIEAIESKINTFVILTQFHPEILAPKDTIWNKLFQEFRKYALEIPKRRRT